MRRVYTATGIINDSEALFLVCSDSSEIGYAGSPPRAALLRGQSIDSVDRPFHPSEWVDVNLEVPCTPGASVLSTSANQQRSGNLTKSNGKPRLLYL